MKRDHMGDMLTGGTRDVNPQWLTASVTQASADGTTTGQIILPIEGLPRGNKIQVIELLKVYFYPAFFPATASATEASDLIAAFVTTSSNGTTSTNFANPNLIAGFQRQMFGAFTAGGTARTLEEIPIIQDLTDGAGHGIVIATQNLFMQVASSGTGAANSVRAKFLYRFKNIGLQEYYGIVTSQQAPVVV